MPNAGLPSVVDGKMHYDLTAEQFVEHQTRFVEELGVSVVGGCCGTTPEYIRGLAEAVAAVRSTGKRASSSTAPRRSTAWCPSSRTPAS
jgi:5-methyltetrahydrofolate--homocysteine methyltransferase